jgi:hypothetical protein
LAKSEGPRDIRSATPNRIVDTTPPLPSGDYSYTLEIVMKMQESMGKLSEAVESLKSQSHIHGEKLDLIGKDVHAAKVVISVVGGLIVLAVGALWVLARAALDFYIAAHPAK